MTTNPTKTGKKRLSTHKSDYPSKFPLHQAVKEGDLKKVQTILKNSNQYGHVTINSIDTHLHTALHSACYRGHYDIAVWLFTQPDLVPLQGDAQGRTALHLCCRQTDPKKAEGTLKCAKLIIEKVAESRDASDTHGKTPLFAAIAHRRVDLMKLLLDNGAQVNAADDDYLETPLHCLVLTCLNSSPSKPHKAMAALSLDTETLTLEAAKLLLSHGADLSARNVNGDTPLHCLVTAIAQGPIGTELRRLIEVFLDHCEVDFSIQNNNEQTALDIANKYKIQWLVDLIAKKQEVTNIERLTKKGITTWSCDELCVWLKLHGLGDYVAKFRANHITGQILVNICTSENSDVLRDELGVQSLGHRTELKNKVLYMYNTQMAQEQAEGGDATNNNANEEPFDEQALNQLLIDITEFDFGEVIGKGYFGEVRKGQWKGVTVALKYIYRQRQEQRKLLQEVYLLSRLRHPNVIQLLGWSQGVVNANEPQTSLVMALEFMEYGSLYHVIKHSYKSLTLNMKWRIMTDIIRGMTYLHGRGVIHRDLNTKNVLVDSNWTTKISDFGLSKLFNADREMTTHVGFLVNMAPEVFKGQHYTQQADVFSFGMVLYELYTGQEPHNVAQLDPLKFAHRIAHEGYRPPLTGVTCEGCPQHVLELVVKCWDSEPSKRPSFAAMLTALMSSNVNKNPPPSPITRTGDGKPSVHVDSSRMESPDVDSNNYYMEKEDDKM